MGFEAVFYRFAEVTSSSQKLREVQGSQAGFTALCLGFPTALHPRPCQAAQEVGPGRTHEATCPESLIWRVKHVMAVEINIERVPQKAAASALCWLALKIGRMVSPPACGCCDDNHVARRISSPSTSSSRELGSFNMQ